MQVIGAAKFRPDKPQSPEEAVIGLLMQAGRRLRTRDPEDEVEPSSFPLAKQLMHHRAMRISELAAKVELDTSTVSRQIRQLEDRGMVVRTADPEDGRAYLVQLTEYGTTTVRAAMRRRLDRIGKVLASWDAHDKAELQRLLTQLAADLRVVNDDAEQRGPA